MTNEKSDIAKITVDEVVYTINMTKITIQQLIDIENGKVILSQGTYGSLVATKTKTSLYALDLIDAVAYLSVLFPGLAKDLNYKSYLDIPVTQAKKLIKAYQGLLPAINDFYNGILNEFNLQED
jgi:hypothetical protein